MEMKITCVYMMQPSQNISVTVQGMDGEVEAKGVELVFEHERTWIGRRRKGGRYSGGRKGRFKEVEGGMRGRGFKEAQGLPQKTGPVFPMGDGIKAACLDENTHVLEMDMAGCPKEKMVEACEGPVFRSFADKKLHSLL
jgi:hypothetical protein